jgi:hypothetical protein
MGETLRLSVQDKTLGIKLRRTLPTISLLGKVPDVLDCAAFALKRSLARPQTARQKAAFTHFLSPMPVFSCLL